MPITLDGVKYRPNHILVRVLAAIGILLLIERSVSYYQWRYQSDTEHTFSAIGNLGISSGFETTHFHDGPTNASNGVRKSIIVASLQKEHTEWVNRNFDGDWEINTYVVDDETANYTVFKNAGHESSVYLTYIINHYWDLPDYMVFIHAKRYQWHNDDPMFDGIPAIRDLRLDHLEDSGYLSLRAAHFPGCPVGLRPDAKVNDGFWGIRAAYAKAFMQFFPKVPVPKVVGAPCCAQFAVTRAAVHKRTPPEYERMRQWVWSTGIPGGRSGRIFEYLWHYIFGMPAVYCPSAEASYCQSFGLCDLKCPGRPGSCQGRYSMPPYDSGMAKGWPANGQGVAGYPVDKWWEKFYPNSTYDGFTLRVNSTTPEEKYPTTVVDEDEDEEEVDVDNEKGNGEEIHAD